MVMGCYHHHFTQRDWGHVYTIHLWHQGPLCWDTPPSFQIGCNGAALLSPLALLVSCINRLWVIKVMEGPGRAGQWPGVASPILCFPSSLLSLVLEGFWEKKGAKRVIGKDHSNKSHYVHTNLMDLPVKSLFIPSPLHVHVWKAVKQA